MGFLMIRFKKSIDVIFPSKHAKITDPFADPDPDFTELNQKNSF